MNKSTLYSIYIEATPNPNTLKFVSNKWIIVSDKTLEINPENENIKISPLAQKLFQFPFVKKVFLADNFISITKTESINWQDIQLELRDFITEELNSKTKVVNDSFDKVDALENQQDTTSKNLNKNDLNELNKVKEESQKDLSTIDKKIIDILDEYIKPSIQQDGGAIDFIKYTDGKVFVELKGACSGCPSSTQTLKNGIEELLKNMLPNKIKAVEAINS